MVIGIVVTIGVVSLFGYCILGNTGMDEEERKREDDEQLEWLRRQREKNDRN